MTQRHHGEGSMRQRSPGVWELTFLIRRGSERQRVRGYATFRGNETQARAELRRLVVEAQQGDHVRPTKQTLESYLRYWVEEYARQSLKPTTADEYLSVFGRYVFPALGSVALADTLPTDILTVYRKMRERGLTERTLLNLHRPLKEAFRYAVLWQLLKRSPMDAVPAPRAAKADVQALASTAYAKFIEAIDGSPYKDVYIMAIYSAMRRSELLGLQWPNVDTQAGSTRVERVLRRVKGKGLRLLEPKTKNSRRTVYVDGPALDVLKRLEAARVGLFVFSWADGRPFYPDEVTKDCTTRLRAAGIEGVTLHGLRHTHASWALAAGEPLIEVSRTLGHASIQITADIYGHVEDAAKRSAASRFSKRVEGA